MSESPALGRIAVIGAGILGVRIARELLTPAAGGHPSSGGVILVTRRAERREQLSTSFGSQLHVTDSATSALPADVRVVVVARAAGEQLAVITEQMDAGRHVVATSDDLDEVRAILALSGRAEARGVAIVAGATMSPGLSCLLADHAATLLERVDEVHVARHGVAGPACARQRLKALRGSGLDLRDGEWVKRPGFSGRELNWFPDPVGARDCYRAALAEPLLLHAAFPDVSRLTARLAASRRDRALAPFPVLVPPPDEGGLGALRVELRGDVGGERRTVVYGALDRPAIAAAGVAAVSAIHLLEGSIGAGAGGLAGRGVALSMLTELARRGIRAAAFEGDSAGSVADASRPGAEAVGGSDGTSETVQVSTGSAEESHIE